jgi:hypothetical protein
MEAAAELECSVADRDKYKEKRDKERQKERAKVEKEKENDEGKEALSIIGLYLRLDRNECCISHQVMCNMTTSWFNKHSCYARLTMRTF